MTTPGGGGIGGGGQGAINLATLWIPVVPETSAIGPAMEQAGRHASDRFKDIVRRMGSDVADSFRQTARDATTEFTRELESRTGDLSSVGTRIGEELGTRLGEAAGGLIRDNLPSVVTESIDSIRSRVQSGGASIGEALGTEIGQRAGELLRDLPGVNAVVEKVQEVSAAAGPARDAIASMGDAMAGARAGDFAGALANVHEGLRNAEPLARVFGIDISNWDGPLAEAANRVSDIHSRVMDAKSQAQDFANIFVGLPGVIGRVGGAIAELAGPLAAGVALGKQLSDTIMNIPGVHDYFYNPDGSARSPIERRIEEDLPWVRGLTGAGPDRQQEEDRAKAYAPTPGAVPLTPQNLVPGSGGTPPAQHPRDLPGLLMPGGAPSPGSGPTPVTPHNLPGILGLPGAPGAPAPAPAPRPAAPAPAAAAPSAFVGAPGGGTPLASALSAKGFSPEQIRLIEGFSQVEGNNPAGNPTLGFTDAQLGGRSDLPAHVDALAQQFRDRASVAGAFPQGGTDQQQAEWIARVVGQAGVSSDWQGNAQPKDYVPRVVNAMQGITGGGGSARTTSTASSGMPAGMPTGMPGGAMPGGGDFGAAAGSPSAPPPNENAIRTWVQQNFGIPNTFGTGSWENASHPKDQGWHGKGYAFDFHGTPDQMAALANWVANNYSQDTLELIYGGGGFDRSREIKNAKFGDVYGAGLNAEHTDHVHWAMTMAPFAAAAARGGGMPGIPGMPGMSGVLGMSGVPGMGTAAAGGVVPVFVTNWGGGAGGAGGPAGVGGPPSGTPQDPLHVAPGILGGGAAGSGGPQQPDILGGLMQMFGLDGSVFKTFSGSSNPLQFTGVKTLSSLMSQTGGGGAGGGGGGGGMLSSLFNMIPGMPVSAGAVPHPGGGAPPGPAVVNNTFNGDVHPFNVTQNGVASPTSDLQSMNNSSGRSFAMAQNLPTAGG